MSERYVYLVDADANLNSHLVGELGRYGFRVGNLRRLMREGASR